MIRAGDIEFMFKQIVYVYLQNIGNNMFALQLRIINDEVELIVDSSTVSPFAFLRF